MKKKYKLITICSIIVLSILISTCIYSYYTYQKSIENTVILAYNEIQVNELYEPPLEMKKGISFKKEPTIKNVGNIDCYVRVKSLISDSRVENGINIDYNLNDFTYNIVDQYYYYNKVLSPGESSKPLFTTVTIHNDAEDIVLEGFDIYIYSESVQTLENKNMMDVWNYFNQ